MSSMGNSMQQSRRWLVPCGNQGNSVIIRGWHQATFEWDLCTLYTRQAQLRKVKLIIARRPSMSSGSYHEFYFDQLPVALLSQDTLTMKHFSPFLDGFSLVPIRAGFIEGNRFEKYPRDKNVLVPLPEVMYSSPESVPANRHFAVIDGKFCISAECIACIPKYFTRPLLFRPYEDHLLLPSAVTDDFSNIFLKREAANPEVIAQRIYTFIIYNLHRYHEQHGEPLSGILLDCDPQYGYVNLALKQTPVVIPKATDIDDFELDRYATLDALDLYGDTKYLSASRLGGVLKRVILALAEEPIVRELAHPGSLRCAYAFHDEDIHWVARIDCSVTSA